MAKPKTGSWKDIEHFKPSDFKCRCGKCNGLEMDLDVVRKLDQVASLIGLPLSVQYGAVCPKAGTSGPAHFALEHFPDLETRRCYAVDIRCPSNGAAPTFRYRFIKAALEVGFRRIEVGKSYIHVDDHPKNSEETIWLRF